MVNKKIRAGMLVLALIFGMTVVGCGNDTTNGGDVVLADTTWVGEDQGYDVVLQFYSNSTGSFTHDGANMDFDITYSVSGNSVTITGTPEEMTGSISGNSMNLMDTAGNSISFSKSNTGGSNTGGSNTGGSNTGGSNNGGSNTGGSNTGGSNTGGNNTGGSNTGGSNTGGSNTGGSNTGGSNTGGSNTGGAQVNTFTPPSRTQLTAFLEDYRTDTANEIAGENPAVYIKSITVNSYTVDGSSITANPSSVPEDAEVQVKFTVRTILSFNNLSMGERLNIDNFRIDLQSDLQSWLEDQGFGYLKISVTTGNTVFG